MKTEKLKLSNVFAKKLLHWHKTDNLRTMPWKGEKDAYKIWLSEIMLQQTRVEQGLDYYLKFIKNFPTVVDLANANDDIVFKMWEGLGYYSRCKNLLYTARLIRDNFNGVFPYKYEDIINLKGVGAYTAAAIASFAYGLPYAVVDGNVYRILSRYFAINIAVDSVQAKKHYTDIAQDLLDKSEPAKFNQAMMDLGATICKPKLPLCDACPLQKKCIAYKNSTVNKYPFKEKKILVTEKWINFLIITCNNKVLVGKREGKDIWQNLYQFFPLEIELNLGFDKSTIENVFFNQARVRGEVLSHSNLIKQRLTHRLVQGYFVELRIKKEVIFDNFFWIERQSLNNYSFPKFINMYLQTVTLK